MPDSLKKHGKIPSKSFQSDIQASVKYHSAVCVSATRMQSERVIFVSLNWGMLLKNKGGTEWRTSHQVEAKPWRLRVAGARYVCVCFPLGFLLSRVK